MKQRVKISRCLNEEFITSDRLAIGNTRHVDFSFKNCIIRLRIRKSYPRGIGSRGNSIRIRFKFVFPVQLESA